MPPNDRTVLLRGPDGKDHAVAEGQALAHREDGTFEVVDIEIKPGSTMRQDEETRKLLADHVAVVREGNTTTENLIKSLMEVLRANQKRSHVIDDWEDPGYEDLDQMTYLEAIESEPQNDWQRALQRAHDKLLVRYQVGIQLARHKRRPIPNVRNLREYKRWAHVVRHGPWPVDDKVIAAQTERSWDSLVGWLRQVAIEEAQQRAAGDVWQPGETTQGGNWTPTGVSRTFINTHRLQTVIVQAFRRLEIPRGVTRLDIPTLTGKAVVRVVAATTGAGPFAPQSTQAGYTPPTGVLSLASKKHGTDPSGIAVEEIEDATIAVADLLSGEHITATGKGHESGLINGQTTNDAAFDVGNGPIPANGYATSDGPPGVGWGLRKYAFAGGHKVDGGAGAATIVDFENGWAGLKNFGIPDGQNQIIAILSSKIWFDLVKDTNIRSVDIAGPVATLPTGALTRLYGIPVFVSDQMPDVDATGKCTGTDNFTFALFVNTNRWLVGVSRDVELRVLEPQLEDVLQMRAFARHCLGYAPPATDGHCQLLYNIAK